MTDYIKELVTDPTSDTESFRYQLLDRMRQDCLYYLTYGGRQAKYLWANEETEHIENMKAIYNSFPEDKRPEWLTMDEIEAYERKIMAGTQEYMRKVEAFNDHLEK